MAQADSTANSTFSEDVMESVELSIGEQLQNFWEFLGTTLFSVKTTEITIASLLVFLALIVFFIILAKLISRLLYRKVLKNIKMDEGIRYTLQRMTNYVIMILGFFFSFQFIGIDLSGLAVIFGLLSVGIGFGLQNLTSNFISGIILLFERPISVGDRIVVNDIEGDVKEINIRSTTITSLNNISIIVPNADFISGSVVNYSYGDQRIRLEINVGVSYDSDLDLVLETLKKVAVENKDVLEDPEPKVFFKDFGDSSWDMVLRCWIPDPYRHPSIKSDLRCQIVREFRKHNIEIPFPQRDVHFRSNLLLAGSGKPEVNAGN